jgi:hypothetical protein
MRSDGMASIRWSVVMALVAAVACSAQAQSLDDQARVLFREGNELYAKGRYEAALAKYRKAKVLYPSYKIDVNIGTTLNALGRHNEAAQHYDLFLRRANKVAPRDLVKDVATLLDELRAKLGTVELTCGVPGATVEVDHHHFGTTPLTHLMYLDPGIHRFTVSKLGYVAYEAAFTVAAGERKTLAVQLQATSPTPPAALTIGAGPTRVETRRRSTVWLATGISTGVAAVAFLGLGAGYNVKTNNEITGSDAFESGRRISIAGYVLAGTMAAGSAVSFLLYARSGRSERAASSRVAAVAAVFLGQPVAW